MQQMTSPIKMKKLEKWREEYLAIRRQIFCFDEDEDVFSLFKLNSKDLKYKGTIRRLQVEFNEDNFNRDLERNEMLTSIQIMKREQNTLLKKMEENWQNPRLMNFLKNEQNKIALKHQEFKDFHGQNFGFIDEEKEDINQYMQDFEVDCYKDIDFNEDVAKKRKSQLQSPSYQQIQKEQNKPKKGKKIRKEFKSQDGLSEILRGSYDSSKRSGTDDNDDTLQGQQSIGVQKIQNGENKINKKRSVSIDQSNSYFDDEDIDNENDDRPSAGDIFVTQDNHKQRRSNGNQYLSKVSELPEEESKVASLKFSKINQPSKGKQNQSSSKEQNLITIKNEQNEFVDLDEEYYNQQIQMLENQNKQIKQPQYQQSPEKRKVSEYSDSKYTTPKKSTARNSPERNIQYSSVVVQGSEYNQDQNMPRERGRSNSPTSKQNISVLDKSLNNISNIEDQKDISQIKDFVSKIDVMIRDIGGVNCGWKQEDHRSFLYLMKKYGQNGLNSLEALSDGTIAVLQFYTDNELLQHINAYNQYNMLMDQKQKYIDEYKEIQNKIEKRHQAELEILKQLRKERELSQLKERIHGTVQRTEFYVKQFENIKSKYKDMEMKNSLEYQKKQMQREKDVLEMVNRKQAQKQMQYAINSKKSQQEMKKANMLKEIHQNEKIQSLMLKEYPYAKEAQNQNVQNEKIMNIQKDLYQRMHQIEELRMLSKSKKIQHVYFTPQINKKNNSPQRYIQ